MTAFLGGLTGPFWPTLIGAVVGAVVGGIITFGIQVNGVRIARQERVAAKRQEDLAAAYGTMVKLVKILTTFRHVAETMLEAKTMLETPRFKGVDLWQVTPPFGGLPAKVSFGEKEVAFVLSTNERGLMLAALELEDMQSNVIDLCVIYSQRREKMTETLTAMEMDGRIALTSFKPEDMAKIAPHVMPLNDLTAVLSGRTPGYVVNATRIFDEMLAHCRKRFGDDFPKLEISKQGSPEAAPST